MAGAKRKYIEATYELMLRDGLEGVSIRKVAEKVGCSSAALYRHFSDIDMLTSVASIHFMTDYIDDARLLSQVDMNPLELNLQLWECLAYYSFQNAAVFENLFFGNNNCVTYPRAIKEFCRVYPDTMEGMKSFMFDMFTDSTIEQRDSILLGRAVESGMLSKESAVYLGKVDSYLYRGMLATVRGRQLDDEGLREVTREFMQMIIRGYTTQLEPGYSILVVSEDFIAGDKRVKDEVRASYRVEVVSIADAQRRKERATA